MKYAEAKFVESQQRQDAPERSAAFGALLAIAVFFGIVSCVPLAIWGNRFPWLISIPILGGAFCVLLWELKYGECCVLKDLRIPVFDRLLGRWNTAQVSSLPSGYKGLSAYGATFALEIEQDDKKQLKLFAAGRPETSVKDVRKITDEHGNEVLVVTADRFMAMLLTNVLENADKAVELSLLSTKKRLEKSELKIAYGAVIDDKGIREVIKSDIRGNQVVILNRGGEKVIKDIKKSLDAPLKANSSPKDSFKSAA